MSAGRMPPTYSIPEPEVHRPVYSISPGKAEPQTIVIICSPATSPSECVSAPLRLCVKFDVLDQSWPAQFATHFNGRSHDYFVDWDFCHKLVSTQRKDAKTPRRKGTSASRHTDDP
ncbi:MAG: hypothetical protein AUG75_13335 [Cyanobacteria bacterium 13_1_20CM_4_61_6]|nr:MAG: hypothetical protein AUG75_13335 [Cyanobacteria bacterium 13_1_20CM_4_61_6]